MNIHDKIVNLSNSDYIDFVKFTLTSPDIQKYVKSDSNLYDVITLMSDEDMLSQIRDGYLSLENSDTVNSALRYLGSGDYYPVGRIVFRLVSAVFNLPYLPKSSLKAGVSVDHDILGRSSVSAIRDFVHRSFTAWNDAKLLQMGDAQNDQLITEHA
jgi:hypothetical protein